MKVNGTDIFMTRGDTERIEVSLFDKEADVQRDFIAGDKVYFTVKTSTQTKDKIIQKEITDFTDGKAIVLLESSDTQNLKYYDYVYDVQMITDNGSTVTTIIKPSKFVIEEEVTYEDE
jgi:hypothetical protein